MGGLLKNILVQIMYGKLVHLQVRVGGQVHLVEMYRQLNCKYHIYYVNPSLLSHDCLADV